MKIEKAIEILNHYCSKDSRCYDSDLYDSIKLGIQALKAWKEHRGTGSLMSPLLLPGETQD